MTATKEQPNQRQNQPQQDEVGNWLFLWSSTLSMYRLHYAKLYSLLCKVSPFINI